MVPLEPGRKYINHLVQEEEGEPGKIEIRPKDLTAEELDFQHGRIQKIENLEGLTKIEVLGFRYRYRKIFPIMYWWIYEALRFTGECIIFFRGGVHVNLRCSLGCPDKE